MNQQAHAPKTPLSPHNSVEHYENFPVASILLPKACVPAVQALYRFARAADDIADEGDASTADRLALLNALLGDLQAPMQASSPLVRDLTPFISKGVMPEVELENLLSAFIQDVQQDAAPDEARHAHLSSLLNYCSRSANPVGRMMLRITSSPYNAQTEAWSDNICTALQLINFWQDIAKDALRGRCYVPQAIFQQHGCPASSTSPEYRAMMADLGRDARTRMLLGTPLLKHLKGRFKAEIALTMAGGLRVLDKLARSEYAIQNPPLKLGWADALPIAAAAIGLIFKRP